MQEMPTCALPRDEVERRNRRFASYPCDPRLFYEFTACAFTPSMITAADAVSTTRSTDSPATANSARNSASERMPPPAQTMTLTSVDVAARLCGEASILFG